MIEVLLLVRLAMLDAPVVQEFLRMAVGRAIDIRPIGWAPHDGISHKGYRLQVSAINWRIWLDKADAAHLTLLRDPRGKEINVEAELADVGLMIREFEPAPVATNDENGQAASEPVAEE